jgi:hypothetical protein
MEYFGEDKDDIKDLGVFGCGTELANILYCVRLHDRNADAA